MGASTDLVATPPPPHPREAERIDELRRLQILDTSPELRFDRLTRIAQRALDMPIAVVSLVDVNRQWFKSTCGIDATETPRDVAFCAHAILGQEDLFVIPDAHRDPRFRDNPLVTGPPHVCFYAGAVLRGPNLLPMGTLCVIDHVPRQLSGDEREILVDLAGAAADELFRSQREQILQAQLQAAMSAKLNL